MIFENIRTLREDRDIKQYTLANFYKTSVDYLLGLVDKPNQYFKE